MMPFYGRADHLKAAVTSVLEQTDPRWRLVVLDDRNPDPEPGEWVAGLGDPRVEYRLNDENLGVSGNFNLAADLVRSEHCVLMGCDDVMLPDYVERIFGLIDGHRDADIIQPGVRVIGADGEVVSPLGDRIKDLLRPSGSPPSVHRGEELAASLLRGNWAYFPSICWRAEPLRRHGFRADLSTVQDLALMMNIIRAGGTMVVDDVPVFAYRRHGASVSSALAVDGERFVQERTVFAEEAARLAGLGWYRAARAARRHATSRLNALVQLPLAVAARDLAGTRTLVRHAFGSTGFPGGPG